MEDKEILYRINNLSCRYKGQKDDTLLIKELMLYKGEVAFVVGVSGIGKSTSLETLGVMSNTIGHKQSPDAIFQFQKNGVSPIDLLKVWNRKESSIAKFRESYLSFIFQETNLFQNLTAFENCLTPLLIEGKKPEEANLKARQAIEKMFKQELYKEIIRGRKITEMSGGQRQRLSFIRAIVAEYEILFADEPTGNLDWGNACRLLDVLTGVVKHENRTAMIVSHDINLAVKYGDRIILIKEEQSEQVREGKKGLINQESVFTKSSEKSWYNIKKGLISEYEMLNLLKDTLFKL